MENYLAELAKELGEAKAKTYLLGSLVETALKSARLDFQKKDGLVLEDNGRGLLFLIEAFYPEEVAFRKAELKREQELYFNSLKDTEEGVSNGNE